MVRDALGIWRAAAAGARPASLLERVDLDDLLERPLEDFGRVAVVGVGKGAMAMAGALEPRLGEPLAEGLAVVPHGYRASFPEGEPAPRRVEVLEAGHPVPDEAGVEAARRALAMAEGLGEDDLLLVLVSGGGSALWPAFAEGIALEDAQATFRLLLASGADIHALNTVRRHLSRIGGGRLAEAAHPASLLALVISDVVGDDLATISSGPTVPDPTTFEEAAGVLRRFGLWGRVPEAVRAHLERGLRGEAPETPKPGDPAFERTRTVLIGSNRDAREAARAEAERRGYAVVMHEAPVVGEAREAGRRLAAEALATPPERPTCLVWGGETTVTVTGEGRGGRNQELALGAALALESAGREVVLLSGGTDGIDGPTDAAGAWATRRTIEQARALGLDPLDHLARNDACPFFEALGQLVRTGPTHTNVMDVQVALLRP